MYFLLTSYALFMFLKVLSHFTCIGLMKIREIFQRRGLEIFQNCHEIIKHFKVKYFIAHRWGVRQGSPVWQSVLVKIIESVLSRKWDAACDSGVHYLSHCYRIARDRLKNHLRPSVCLYVCLSALLWSQFFVWFWWNFAHKSEAWKVRTISLGGQSPMTPSPISPLFFNRCNAFSMKRSKYRRNKPWTDCGGWELKRRA